MEVPIGFIPKLWSFTSFLPFFLMLLVLGVLKASVISPIAFAIIMIGNFSIIVGLWPAHFFWTFYCVARTKRFGLVLKLVLLMLLPVPLVLWPILGVVASLLGAIAYGLFCPLLATFEAVGENVPDKFYHCFADGCWSTIKRSCIIVQDFMDFCFHSYFSYMDELRESLPYDENPLEIKLSLLPGCFLVIFIGVPLDVIFISGVAIYKSPYMLFKGWKRLVEDLVGREGPFLETVCVPFAGLAILLWPMAVAGAVAAAVLSSFFLGFYGAAIVQQENSTKMGFAYVVSVVSLFDEYVNDMLYLREGSCLPRPRYRRNTSNEQNKSSDTDRNDSRIARENSLNSKLLSDHSRTFMRVFQNYKAVQVWDWLFKSCEVNGRILLRDGLLSSKDIEDCIVKGNCKKLGIKLPAWSLLQCLLASVKSSSAGLVISEGMELTKMNGPRDKVFEWLVGPLLIIKEQLKRLQLDENEEMCLKKLVMTNKNENPEDWDKKGFPSGDNVRIAQLQAIIRRLQGIVASMSRIPTFRRRFRNLLKVLYIEALQASASGGHIGLGGIIKARYKGNGPTHSKETSEARQQVRNAEAAIDAV